MIELKNRQRHLQKTQKRIAQQMWQIQRMMRSPPNLRGIDLRRAKLKNAKLDGAILAEANLAKADIAGASLVKTDLSDANLKNVELGAAQLTDADLSRANLRGAGIYAADFSGSNLSGAVLRDVDGWEDAVWTMAYYLADDPPWWPEGMDAKKLYIREMKSEEKPIAEKNPR